MGQRQSRFKKKKAKHQLRSAHQISPISQPKLSPAMTKSDRQIEEKNDTIATVDFFGFSPQIYWSDLKKTALATGVIIIILCSSYILINLEF
jgi:hypothetical protein